MPLDDSMSLPAEDFFFDEQYVERGPPGDVFDGMDSGGSGPGTDSSGDDNGGGTEEGDGSDDGGYIDSGDGSGETKTGGGGEGNQKKDDGIAGLDTGLKLLDRVLELLKPAIEGKKKEPANVPKEPADKTTGETKKGQEPSRDVKELPEPVSLDDIPIKVPTGGKPSPSRPEPRPARETQAERVSRQVRESLEALRKRASS